MGMEIEAKSAGPPGGRADPSSEEKRDQALRPIKVSKVVREYLGSIVIYCPKCGQRVPLRFL